MTSPTRTRRFAIISALLILATVLAACAASGGEGDAADGAVGEDAAQDREAIGEPGAPAEEQGTARDADEPGGFLAPIEQRIVKTGEVSLEVENVGEAIGRVRAMAASLNGYVGGSQAGTLDDRATLTLRIPATSFDEALAQLHELDAEVVAEATREQDVTGQVVDLQARIDNLRASETSYRELVARAERVEDILAVQSRLDDVRGQIEQLAAQLEALEGQAALSTLTVTLVPRPAPVTAQAEVWDPRAQLDQALASLVGMGQGLLNGLIWFVVVWVPVLLVLALLVLVTLRGVLEVRRRMPATAPQVRDEAAS